MSCSDGELDPPKTMRDGMTPPLADRDPVKRRYRLMRRKEMRRAAAIAETAACAAGAIGSAPIYLE